MSSERPSGVWTPEFDDHGSDIQTPHRWKLTMSGFVIHLFRSAELPGTWKWSCTPVGREEVLGRMSEADAKRCALLQVEARLQMAVVEISTIANGRVRSAIGKTICVS